MQGCPSLIPVHKLIASVSVEQRYDKPHSFCHRLSRLKSVASKLRFELVLLGPIPDAFPPCKLDTPHWSLPSTIATPSSLLPFKRIVVQYLHLPSFSHVIKYVSHFGQADDIVLENMTWDTNESDTPIRFRHVAFPKMKGKDLSIETIDCEKSVRLSLQVMNTHPRSILCALPVEERELITVVIMWLQEALALRNIWLGNVGFRSDCKSWRFYS